jgi:predicted nucleotidyltransferase
LCGLEAKTLQLMESCFKKYPDISWVKIYGSRAKGNYQRGSDIDLAFSSSKNYSAKLLGELDNLPLPYLFDVTHYETLKHSALKETYRPCWCFNTMTFARVISQH